MRASLRRRRKRNENRLHQSVDTKVTFEFLPMVALDRDACLAATIPIIDKPRSCILPRNSSHQFMKHRSGRDERAEDCFKKRTSVVTIVKWVMVQFRGEGGVGQASSAKGVPTKRSFPHACETAAGRNLVNNASRSSPLHSQPTHPPLCPAPPSPCAEKEPMPRT
jgi:hypothetical protein